MTLLDDWRILLARAWSIRLNLMAAAITGLTSVWFAFYPVVPLWVFAAASVGLHLAAVILRLLKQPEPSDE